MTLDKKIFFGFISCTAVLILVAVISFRNSDKFISTSKWVGHTHEVLYEIEQILLHSVDAETGVRGYVVSGKPTFLESYSSSKKEIDTHLNRFHKLTADNPAQQKNFSLLTSAIASRMQNLDTSVDLGQSGNLDEARERVSSLEGKKLQEEIKSILAEARSLEEILLAQRSQESEDDAYKFNLLFVVLMTVITITLIAGYVTITTNVRALRRAEAETTDRNWFLSGSSELTKRMQGNQSVHEISESVLNAVVNFLNVQTGALYVRDRNVQQLKLESTYALEKNHRKQLVLIGEGIVGQVVAEKKEILLHDIKTHDYDLSTTFGNLRPKSILAAPLVFEDRVVGVLELGSLNVFTEQQREFIRLISDSIGIGLVSAQARQEAKDLLEETQRQSEELEAQQHELRQANEELQAKTDQLERSEMTLKAQQEELQQVNIELEEKANVLEEQKHKLQEAKEDLEQKAHELDLSSKYKSEFLANMSHELRTPLNSILILSQLLAENKHERMSEKEIAHAKNIYSSGTDLLNLINEILDLSKVEAGKLQLEVTTFALEEICQRTEDTFQELGKSKSVHFTVTCDNPGTSVTSDRQRIEQIVKNLLSNAFKFTPAGGKVSLEIREVDNDMLSFAVTDTGIGIAEDKRQIIFEAFQQADGSTKRKYGGTGLGLSISRELAHALGGRIYLESKEGSGSTFTLVIPSILGTASIPAEKKITIKEKASKPQEQRVEPPADYKDRAVIDDRNSISENDRTILIIEDDEKFAQTLLGFIRNRNYKGVIALDGSMGLSFARHYRPDAILLDMKLPVMDGYEVLNHLKTDPDLRHIPVQIISGFDRQKESLALGAFDYLMKPVEIQDLHRAFDRIEQFTSKQLKKLLIIEDNVQQNSAIRELIGNGDVKSLSAYSGKEAQEMLTQESFDCVIVDLGLPDMSGFDLLEHIKANQQLSSIPIIVYTGKDLTKDEAERLKKLSDTVVLKTASSHERLLDETTLFLHRVESKLPKHKQMIIRKLHRTDDVLKGKTILLVDDDIRNIYSLTSALDDEGVTCLTAENGRIALEMLQSHDEIDLVLMDIMMPEMDGYEATIEIRKTDKFRTLPIIALTAKAMKGDKEKCLSVGMSDYISKPVNMEQLLSLMKVWLYKAHR